MKLAVIGAGSTYTPELVSGLSALDVDELALHDIAEERREIVGGLARRMLDRVGYRGRLETTGELERALDGADFVLIQIRVGGQEARLRDETIPLPCGCIGQETTGAGGLAKALRTVPVVLEIADEVRRRAAPGAWIVDFTNPVGIVTRALLDHGHRAVGLCNVSITFQRHAAQLLGVEPARIEVDQVGLNHLTWVRALRLDGEDVLGPLMADHGDALAEGAGLPRRLLEELGAVPSYYLHYFYEHDRVLAEQREGVPRAAEVAEIERQLLEMYRDPSLNEKPALLERRGGAFYSEAATGIVASLSGAGDAVHDRRHAQRTARSPGWPTTTSSRSPRASAPDGAGRAAARRRWRRSCSASPSTSPPTSGSPCARRCRGSPLDVRKALLAHPLIGQDEMAGELVERLLAGEPVR